MQENYNEKLWWANPTSRRFLHEKYFPKNVSLEDRIDEIVNHVHKISGDLELSKKYRELIEYGHITQPSPMWSNFGTDRNNNHNISCNGNYTPDSIEGFAETLAETMMLTKASAGTSAFIGDIRPKGSPISSGGFADGPMPLVKQIDGIMSWVTQGNRRGRIALYMNADHPQIDEFLEIGTESSDIQHIMTGVCVSDAFMERVVSRDMEWSGMDTWAKIIQSRKETGMPYIFFEDTANRESPVWYDNKRIYASNLCVETMIPADKDETFVCNLMAVNLITRHLWPDHIYDTVIRVMDLIQEEYIQQTKDKYGFRKAHNFAKRHRSLGLGVCGWHDILQRDGIPVDSIKAYQLNNEIFSEMDRETLKVSKKLAQELGEPEVTKGHGVRNATRLALMPTTSSAFILGGASQSIEVKNSNYFVKDLAGGVYTYKNPYLKKILSERGYDNREVWQSILKHGGSVQQLDGNILTEHEKNVFRTAFEVSQLAVLKQAAQRQKHIDQGQSLNLFIHADTPTREINMLLIEAWKIGIKGLYYHRSTNVAQELSRSLMECETCAM